MKKHENPEEKLKKVYVKNVEKLVRSCIEYSKWADDLRDKTLKCALCGRNNDKLVPFEVHHTPETLFEIVDKNTVDTTTLTLSAALEIFKMHLENKISFKVVCTCCHLAEHNKRRLG